MIEHEIDTFFLKPLPLVTPLKFLMLKTSDPALFEKLLSLESHVEELKKSERWPQFQSEIIEPLIKLDFDEDLICRGSYKQA